MEDLEVSTLDMIAIIMQVEELATLTIPDADIQSFKTFGDMVKYVDANTVSRGRRLPAQAVDQPGLRPPQGLLDPTKSDHHQRGTTTNRRTDLPRSRLVNLRLYGPTSSAGCPQSLPHGRVQIALRS